MTPLFELQMTMGDVVLRVEDVQLVQICGVTMAIWLRGRESPVNFTCETRVIAQEVFAKLRKAMEGGA